MSKMAPEEKELREALKRYRRAMDVLMPGIGRLAIPAEEIGNINLAFLAADRILTKAEREWQP